MLQRNIYGYDGQNLPEDPTRCVEIVHPKLKGPRIQCLKDRKLGNFCTFHGKRRQGQKLYINETMPRWEIDDALSLDNPVVHADTKRAGIMVQAVVTCRTCCAIPAANLPCICEGTPVQGASQKVAVTA